MSEFAYIHINRPSSTMFIARVRRPGRRLYKVIGKPTRRYELAVWRMARAFTGGDYKRADVLMTADYYEPIMCCELVKR